MVYSAFEYPNLNYPGKENISAFDLSVTIGSTRTVYLIFT